jgi:hypothetical protein
MMDTEYTLTTPEDFINAWCGKQTSSLCDTQIYILEAQALLLCSLGATPRGKPSCTDDMFLSGCVKAV